MLLNNGLKLQLTDKKVSTMKFLFAVPFAKYGHKFPCKKLIISVFNKSEMLVRILMFCHKPKLLII